jgi:hypothetical protein
VADVFIYFQKERAELEPKFDDCGNFCPQENEYKDGFCANCPVMQNRKNFKKACLEEIEANPKSRNCAPEFENIYATLLGVVNLTDLSSAKISYRTSHFINAWKAAKQSSERADEFNRRQNSN